MKRHNHINGRITLIVSFVCVFFFTSAASGQISIQLKQNDTELHYDQPVRLDQVLDDAYKQLSFMPYSLGTALFNPNKQQQVDTQKQGILQDLAKLNSTAAQQLARQLNAMSFAFREKIESDPLKVTTHSKLNPLIESDYLLSLPSRIEHIFAIEPEANAPIKLPLKANSNLKDYLLALPNSKHNDTVWIIQANGDVYQATDIQWQDKLYFLSPGAIVFIGLDNLPDALNNLNARIAHLLAFYTDI